MGYTVPKNVMTIYERYTLEFETSHESPAISTVNPFQQLLNLPFRPFFIFFHVEAELRWKRPPTDYHTNPAFFCWGDFFEMLRFKVR